MIYKNSIKILFSNFSNVWKVMIYFLSVFACCVGLLFLLVNPILKFIQNAGFFEEFIELYSSFISKLDLPVFFEGLSSFVDKLFAFVGDHWSSLWGWFLGVFLVVFLLLPFVFSLSNIAICKFLHLYIGSMNKQGFFASLNDDFSHNLKFQIFRNLTAIPFNLAYFSLFMLSLRIFGISWLLNVIAVFVVIVEMVVLFAFKTMIFSTWGATYVVLNNGVFKSFRTAVKVVVKKFGRYFSAAVGVVITIFILNVFLGIFTFVVGFVVSIPISYMLYNIFGMVSVYEGQGMRYYVDVYNVITPPKKEVSDKLKDMKFIV